MNNITIPTIQLGQLHHSSGNQPSVPILPSASSMPVIEAHMSIVSTSGSTKVLYSSSFLTYGVDRMLVDNEEVAMSTSIRFTSNGDHVVKYVAATIPTYCFYGCSRLTKAVVPVGITRIGSQAFRDCPLLKDITLPSSIAHVGDNAFDKMSDATIRINGTLTDYLKNVLSTYFAGSRLFVNKQDRGIIE